MTPAASYSTGQIAENAAHTVAMTTTAATTHRHWRDGSRPSGKQTTDSVVSASAIAVGHTPSHPHHRLPSDVGECPIWRPKNSTASTTPVARNSRPSR